MRLLLFLSLIPALTLGGPLAVDQFGKVSDLPDRTEELETFISQKHPIPGGVYRITKSLRFDLEKLQSMVVKPASGSGITIIMDAPGPALLIAGTHQGTASPKTFNPSTWHQRMPIISGIEIIGNHPDAVGMELTGCIKPIISRVTVRWCKHGIHLTHRNRNVAISDCHLYENSGVGLFLDDVNLHQINVTNSHISYNRKGGIVVRDGNVRNLQITGCDIEGNMPDNATKTETANVFLDVSTSEFDKTKSIAEVAITGCTIQHSANYGRTGATIAPGGANIRLRGKKIWPIDSVTITGNVISDTTTSIDIDQSMDVTITGNTFFAPKPANLLVTKSQRIIVSGNTFNPRQFERPGTITFEKSKDCVVANNILNDFQSKDGALILQQCEGFQVRGNILTGCKSGINLIDTIDSNIHDNLFRRFEGDTPISTDKKCSNINVRK